jgi:hypothetical protein
MIAEDLLSRVGQCGGTATVIGDSLRLSAPSRLPDDLVSELRRHKREVLAVLGNAPMACAASTEAWEAGYTRMLQMMPPEAIGSDLWRALCASSRELLDDWAERLAALGWSTGELFGADRAAPCARVDHQGLVWFLRSGARRIVAAGQNIIRLRTQTGASQSFRPAVTDTPGRVSLWELT